MNVKLFGFGMHFESFMPNILVYADISIRYLTYKKLTCAQSIKKGR
jgi:hypothetical protein